MSAKTAILAACSRMRHNAGLRISRHFKPNCHLSSNINRKQSSGPLAATSTSLTARPQRSRTRALHKGSLAQPVHTNERSGQYHHSVCRWTFSHLSMADYAKRYHAGFSPIDLVEPQKIGPYSKQQASMCRCVAAPKLISTRLE